MKRSFRTLILVAASLLYGRPNVPGADPTEASRPIETVAGTKPLTASEDLSKLMMDGLHRFVERKIDESVSKRARHWKRDFSSRDAYERSVQPNRERLLRSIGAVDPRVPASMERFGHEGNDPALVAGMSHYRIYQVRWTAIEGVSGEGLLLEPESDWVASVVALPDADQTPEQLVGVSEGMSGRIPVRPAACGERISSARSHADQPRQ